MCRGLRHFLSLSIVLGVVNLSYALEPAEDDVFIRVIDVGAGLCCVMKFPGDYYVIYDAGLGKTTVSDIQEIIPEDAIVSLLFLSHSDGDHNGAVVPICENYYVGEIVYSGYKGSTTANGYKAIKDEEEEGAVVVNLKTDEFPFGDYYEIGDVTITFVCGFYQPPGDWEGVEEGAEFRNAGSIVIRLEYNDMSVLFCGDAIGRRIDGDADECLATELFMVDNDSDVPIDSDVIIAPHHGGDNASSTRFIETVSPHFVIFSAGTKFSHPRTDVVQRYLDFGVNESDIYRTDRGDKIRAKEWSVGSKKNGKDIRGDDHVDILLHGGDSVIEIAYADGKSRRTLQK